MSKRWICGVLLCALLLGASVPGLAQGQYSFPYAGIQLQAEAGWTVITPDSLTAQAELLGQLGADADTLAADYAVNNTVFEVYISGGPQVSLSALHTEETIAWQEMARMTEADKAALLTAFSQPPYDNTAWSDTMPGYLRCDWTMQAEGIPVTFAALVTVQQGVLYVFTAAGADIAAESLHAANETVAGHLTYLGVTLEAAPETLRASVPAPIEDDGKVTPLALEDFTGVTYDDQTDLFLRTLPGADLMLHTATDTLRGRANEEGLHRYSLSTRRETVYTYTVTAEIEGRTPSTIEVVLERQLTPEAKDEAFRKSARPIETIGYSNIAGAPQAYVGTAVTLRGQIGGYTDVGGFPCVLIYTSNPGKGVWQNPVWVLLTEAVTLEEEDVRTIYGEIRGDTLPYMDEEGVEGEAPVIISRDIS